MKRNYLRAWLCLPILAACANSVDDASSPDKTCATGQALTGRTPRLYLEESLLTRLRARRDANDAAWTALKARCDQLATGRMYAPNELTNARDPDIGQGYQGEDYVSPMFSLGLCYQVVRGADNTLEARYADAGTRLLQAMSQPVEAGGQPPRTDSGYGIRNYGVGMATGFDWLYPALTDDLKQRVVASLNTWVDWYDANGFINDDPIGNYFAGYLLAKTTTALATEGDNPKAATYWADVTNRMWGQLVKPKFTTSMAGGGWPEGWSYGPLAVRNVVQFLWAAKTAKGLSWWDEVPQVRDQAKYIASFAWPSMQHMDDQGMVHGPRQLFPPVATAALLATMLHYKNDPHAPVAQAFAAELMQTTPVQLEPWQQMLFWDPSLPQTSYKSEPLSYLASGPNHIAVRSDWTKEAVWGTFVSGQYINATDSGEQYYNQGSVAIVKGDKPLIVNATGWLPQVAGDDGENLAYYDAYDNARLRRLYNTFFVDGSRQAAMDPSRSQTRIRGHEDLGFGVHARGEHLADMYLEEESVTQFTRDFVYLRPGTFVVFDRTTVADGSRDQWISWHTGSAPQRVDTKDSTQVRFDITDTTGVIGSVRSLLPKNARATTTSLVGGASYRIESHPASPRAAEEWLTVMTTRMTTGADTPEQVRLSNEDGNVAQGKLVGVHVLGSRHAVVLFNSDHAAAGTSTEAEYLIAQSGSADHLLVDMAANPAGYSVTATHEGDRTRVRISAGGPLQVSANGALAFILNANGTVEAPPPPAEPTRSEGGPGNANGGSAGDPGPQGANVSRGCP